MNSILTDSKEKQIDRIKRMDCYPNGRKRYHRISWFARYAKGSAQKTGWFARNAKAPAG